MIYICDNCGDDIFYDMKIDFQEKVFCCNNCKNEYVESCLTFEDCDIEEYAEIEKNEN